MFSFYASKIYQNLYFGKHIHVPFRTNSSKTCKIANFKIAFQFNYDFQSHYINTLFRAIKSFKNMNLHECNFYFIYRYNDVKK